MNRKKEPIRVMFYDDGYNSKTGYGRVSRELTTRLAKDKNFEVFNMNIVDKRPLSVQNNVTCLPIYGDRLNPIKTGYISSYINNISMIVPDIIIPICDAFFLERDGLSKVDLGKKIKFMPYVPIDSIHLGKGSESIFKKSDKILVQSEFAKNELKKYGYKSEVFRHGVNDKEFFKDDVRRLQVREKLKIKEDEKVFLFIGRNSKRKRIPRLLRGFSLFVKNNPTAKVKLLIHGNNFDDYNTNIQEHIYLEEELHDIDLNNKIIIPYQSKKIGEGVSNNEIVDLYHACDWTVSMSQGEGTGLMSLEGFACGKPTIYPENSNWKEILGKEELKGLHERGVSVKSLENVFVGLNCEQPLSSYNDLSIQLAKAYNISLDDYNNLSDNCLNWVKENADWDKITDELKIFILNVVNKND